ncbi:MAG: electron transfer flavoprotein subunit alpha/FixB family protein, partial [Dehalococcoidia bacterium]|nr:electron transfer flavoprotein subunit alpha/FixB family protein [Dehalococcoidia bacterium]
DLSRELLGVARTVAQAQGSRTCAVLLGKENGGLVQELAHYYADLVYLGDSDKFENYNSEIFVDTMETLVHDYQPQLVICGMTANGRDLAACLAARLRTLFVPACVSLRSFEDGRFEVTRLENNGLAQGSDMVETDSTLILAFPPETRGIDSPDPYRKAEVVAVEPVVRGQLRVRHMEILASDYRTIDLSEADIVVSGGHGMDDQESFDLLWGLGELVRAPVAGSRVAVDKGWIPVERMVGASGKILRSNLYLALGISGAIQHITGIKDCKTVIAVNNNPRAEIMQMADLAVVGNQHEILPVLIERLRSHLQEKQKGNDGQ